MKMGFLRTMTALCGPLLLSPLAAFAHVETSSVNENALARDSQIVDCTLENGAAAQCVEFTVKYRPDGLEIGPFCPATLDSEGGIWDWTGDQAGLYRIDRSFLEFLDSQGYTFDDPDGSVHIADIATAQPVHDHACINVSEDTSVTMTVLLPIDPVMAGSPSTLGTVSKIGIGVDGVPIFSDAPSIQRTGHMPALDTCGGHVDPGGWYHWHATSTDIETVFAETNVDADCGLAQNSAALFGFAFDGFPMYGSTEADGSVPAGLDACGGHFGATAEFPDGIYHYHAGTQFPNLPNCLVGVSAQNNFTTTAEAGIGAQNAGAGGRNEPPRGNGGGGDGGPRNDGGPSRQGGPGGPGGMPPGFDQAAEKLGVSADQLMQAMQDSGGRRADLAKVARILGVSEQELRAALPRPPRQ